MPAPRFPACRPNAFLRTARARVGADPDAPRARAVGRTPCREPGHRCTSTGWSPAIAVAQASCGIARGHPGRTRRSAPRTQPWSRGAGRNQRQWPSAAVRLATGDGAPAARRPDPTAFTGRGRCGRRARSFESRTRRRPRSSVRAIAPGRGRLRPPRPGRYPRIRIASVARCASRGSRRAAPTSPIRPSRSPPPRRCGVRFALPDGPGRSGKGARPQCEGAPPYW